MYGIVYCYTNTPTDIASTVFAVINLSCSSSLIFSLKSVKSKMMSQKFVS